MTRYMMATKAFHPGTGIDVSSDGPDICIIESEDGEEYIGRWVTGFGFMGVRFPKATTRAPALSSSTTTASASRLREIRQARWRLTKAPPNLRRTLISQEGAL